MYIPFIPSNLNYLIFGNAFRHISGIIPTVVIREAHEDEMEITDHPIGYGAPITDHAFKKPESVEIEFGWSDLMVVLNGILSGSILKGVGNLMDVYSNLLTIQQSAIPITIGTRRRQYTDMLIQSLSVETDVTTENALLVRGVFRKVNIVQTEELTLDSTNQENPEETGGVAKGGERQPEATQEVIRI